MIKKHFMQLPKFDRMLVFIFALFLLGVGLFYSGRLFLSHLTDGIAAGVVVDGVRNMLPGDHHEQFYRYSLFYENLIRGRLPYYTGYQYASTDFTEGLIFFPFTAIVGLMSFVFGPILSYNLLLLFSYVFVGLAGYYMVKQITKSSAAGMVSGLFLAVVPFRTTFLYGEMVYGVDAVMVPLLIYAIERAKEQRQAKYFFMAGLIMFLTLTANFQLFYWAMFLLAPYFLYVLIGYMREGDGSSLNKLKILTWLLPGLFGCVVYGIYIYTMMKGSALQGGQNFNEILFYTPEPHRLFIKFNGNEKNVYLGLTALFVLPWLFFPLLRFRPASVRSPYIPLFLMLFIVGMLLVFGPIVDWATKLPVYQWMFEHIPGFNGTRTSGRIMALVVVFYAILLGYFVAIFTLELQRRFSNVVAAIFVAAILALIVYDFNYIRPGIDTFARENMAYRSISGKQTKVVTIPFQKISAHYFNATYLPLALKYDVRLFTGHSSFYPKIMDKYVMDLFSLNEGVIDRVQWKWLTENGYEYVVAHATEYQPRVDNYVIGALSVSPYLELLTDDEGVYLYRLRKIPLEKRTEGNRTADLEAWASAIEKLPTRKNAAGNGVGYAYGWYEREAYPNQKPFRWMRGVDSILVLESFNTGMHVLSFDYLCPDRGPLKIVMHRAKFEVTHEKLNDGWSKARIGFMGGADKTVFVNLQATRLFEAPPDTRKFGCQVGDIEFR